MSKKIRTSEEANNETLPAIVETQVVQADTLETIEPALDYRDLNKISKAYPQTAEIIDSFGAEFFAAPQIMEMPFQSYPKDKFRFAVTVSNQMVRYPEEITPRVFDPKVFFLAPFIQMVKLFGIENLLIECEKEDDYSGMLRVSLRQRAKTVVEPGDILYPALELKLSQTNRFRNGINFAFHRVWCRNGATRKEIISFDDVTEIILLDCAPIMQLMEAQETIEYAKIQTLSQKLISASRVESEITQEICKLGFQKKSLEIAHYHLHKESEDRNQPLNAWIVYNGFNSALFNPAAETSLTRDKKTKLDEKIFDYLMTIEQ